MEKLATHSQKDVFPELEGIHETDSYSIRRTGKAIIFNSDNQVALVGNTLNSLYLLPGGGILNNETIEEGIVRECLEETGCHISLISPLGMIEDFRGRDKKHYLNYCYTAKVANNTGVQRLTVEEKENGLHVVWVAFQDAIQILDKEISLLRNGQVKFYNTGFNIMRDHRFIIEASKKIGI